MPKKKKPSNNPYFFFIMEKKRELENKGYRMGSFDNVSKEFGHVWSRMSKEERAPYEQMSKEAKAAAGVGDVKCNVDTTPITPSSKKGNLNKKYTVTGETYAQVQQKNLDQQEAERQMEMFIRRLTHCSGYPDHTYIFVKTVFCVEEIIDRGKPQYWPSEISLAAFSLRRGLKSVYTQLVDIVNTPVGYASQAKEYSEETGLPIPGDDKLFGNQHRDYLKILKNINGFANHWLKDGYDVPGHRKVFFCLNTERDVTKSCFQWLVNQLNGRERKKYQHFVDHLKLYKISKLVLAMAEQAHNITPSYDNYLVRHKLESAADQVVLKGNYDYCDAIVCSYHKMEIPSLKMNMCSQSVVLRRMFMLFEEFLPPYRFGLTKRHDIGNLSVLKVRGPITKKRRITGPEGEDVKVISKPSWFDDDDDSTKTKTRISSSHEASSVISHEPSWLNDDPPAAPRYTKDDEFPVLGARESIRQRGSTFRNDHCRDSGSSKAHHTSRNLGDEDFPALGISTNSQSQPKNQQIPPYSSKSQSVRTADSSRQPSGVQKKSSPPRDLEKESYESLTPPPPSGPKTFMDSDDDGGDDEIAPKKASDRGMGRGAAASRSFMDDDDDDDFPPLRSSAVGAVRGRGRGGGW